MEKEVLLQILHNQEVLLRHISLARYDQIVAPMVTKTQELIDKLEETQHSPKTNDIT